MASPFKIESGVLVPAKNAGRTAKYPWRDMQVGDSFLVPVPEGKTVGAIQSLLSSAGLAALGKGAIVTRVTSDGSALRVWRIK